MLGLTSALDNESLHVDSIREYSSYIKKAAVEMDEFIHQLNEDYSKVRKYYLEKNETKNLQGSYLPQF